MNSEKKTDFCGIDWTIFPDSEFIVFRKDDLKERLENRIEECIKKENGLMNERNIEFSDPKIELSFLERLNKKQLLIYGEIKGLKRLLESL